MIRQDQHGLGKFTLARVLQVGSLYNKEMLKLKKNRGFTLIELLIVLVIISITTGILVITNIQTQMQKSRDLQRKTDLARLKTALEMYKTDNNVYPSFSGTYGWAIATGLTALSSGNYLNPIPADPKSGNACPGYLVGINTQNYTIYVQLENTNDPGALSIKPAPLIAPGTCSSPCTTFTVTSGTCSGFSYNYWVNNR